MKKTEKPESVRKFNIKDNEGVNDYLVVHEEFGRYHTRTTMYRSMNRHWTKPGELLLQVEDDGNDIVVKKWHSAGRKKKFDYSNFAELIVFMRTFLKVRPCLTAGTIAEEIDEEKY
jgi:hypothetical protein